MERRSFLAQIAAFGSAAITGCTGPGGEETVTVGTDEPTEATTTRPPTETTQPSTRTRTRTTDSPTATPAATPTDSPTPTEKETPTAAQVVEVGPDGTFRFRPETFTISAGETVRWVWRAGGHNVKPSSVPDGAEWTGTPGEEFDTFDAGYVHSYTFSVAGEYEYYCAPHRSAGMVGSFTVE